MADDALLLGTLERADLFRLYRVQYDLFCGRPAGDTRGLVLEGRDDRERAVHLAQFVAALERQCKINRSAEFERAVASTDEWLSGVPRTEHALCHAQIGIRAVSPIVHVFGNLYDIRPVATAADAVLIVADRNARVDDLALGWGKLLSEHFRKQQHRVSATVVPSPPVIPSVPFEEVEKPFEPRINVPTVREEILENKEPKVETIDDTLPQIAPLDDDLLRRIRNMQDRQTGAFLPQPVRDVFEEMFHIGRDNVNNFNALTSDMWHVLLEDFGASREDLERVGKLLSFMVDTSNNLKTLKHLYGPALLTTTDYLVHAAERLNVELQKIVVKAFQRNGMPVPTDTLHSDSELVARSLFEAMGAKGDAMAEQLERDIVEASESGDADASMLGLEHEMFDPMEERFRGIVDYMTGRLMGMRKMSSDQRDWFLTVYDTFVGMIRDSEEFQTAMRESAAAAGTDGSVAANGTGAGIRPMQRFIGWLVLGFMVVWAILSQLNINPSGENRSMKYLTNTISGANDLKEEFKNVEDRRGNVLTKRGTVNLAGYYEGKQRDRADIEAKMERLREDTGLKVVQDKLMRVRLEKARTNIEKTQTYLGLRNAEGELVVEGQTFLEGAPQKRVAELTAESEALVKEGLSLENFKEDLFVQYNRALSSHFDSEEALVAFQATWRAQVMAEVFREARPGVSGAPRTLSIVKRALSHAIPGLHWAELSTDVEDPSTFIHFANEIAGRVDHLSVGATNWVGQRKVVKDLVALFAQMSTENADRFDAWTDAAGTNLNSVKEDVARATSVISEFEEEALFPRILYKFLLSLLLLFPVHILYMFHL